MEVRKKEARKTPLLRLPFGLSGTRQFGPHERPVTAGTGEMQNTLLRWKTRRPEEAALRSGRGDAAWEGTAVSPGSRPPAPEGPPGPGGTPRPRRTHHADAAGQHQQPGHRHPGAQVLRAEENGVQPSPSPPSPSPPPLPRRPTGPVTRRRPRCPSAHSENRARPSARPSAAPLRRSAMAAPPLPRRERSAARRPGAPAGAPGFWDSGPAASRQKPSDPGAVTLLRSGSFKGRLW